AFVTFPAFAVGDAGEVTVEVRVPEALETEIVGDAMSRRIEGSDAVYTATAIADPSVWSVVVVARDDDALVQRALELEGHEVVVRAWPDDAAWADFVDAQLRRGLPVLEDLIGQDWPTGAPLEVIETAAPYAYGYAGWYWSGGNTVEIGDEFLPEVILHELAHIWFNDRMFVDRWVNEAFAEEYSWRVLEQLGEPPAPPEPVVPDDPAAFRLNGWSDPSIVDDDSDAREHYGYNTSWSVMHQVTTEVGMDRLADVLDAVADREIAYQGDGRPETVGSVTTWRRLLDLLQEVGGSQQAEPLFLAHVATDDEAAVLAERARLRTDYAALVKAGRGWTAPEEV
ncbi:MAG: hypothetical protein L0221_17520, partial [Chloroflexi bacterium]|nr:hypothetical protein [Chloroflexota bacterium]